MKPEQRTVNTSAGTIIYRVEPLIINQKWMGVFVVAHTAVGESQEVQETIQVVIQVMLVVLALSVALSRLAAGKVLAPLQSLKETARSVSESDLTQRIPVQGSGDIAELAITFNDMMERLQLAFASQRDFINDAGHELRAPITIIRGHLELMSSDPEEQQETRLLLLDELARMSRFVDDLIVLAQAE
ncbi:HAMP domain-containing protein [Leptolyngbya sp. FACHB-261]|uniref:HAMP domain-containing protein n=1 Tax=Leptolyngbya sp. FACHB-261 TaxID=2692806 RepID=UPI0018EF7D7A|nr:HAMP domain-containing protein [Leptolyngbya sp. FACHB-261]